MWIILKRDRGFTLVEVLASLTIFTAIAIPLMSFFIQAADYTQHSQNKTIALNVARNVLSYIEKQDFYTFSSFLDDEFASGSGHYFLEINDEDCQKDKEDSYGNTIELFPNRIVMVKKPGQPDEPKDICSAVLAPTINDQDYKDKIKVYITKYNDEGNPISFQSQLTSLKNYTTSEQLASMIDDIDSSKLIAAIDKDLLRVFVVVEWDSSKEDIVLEGVLANEKIR